MRAWNYLTPTIADECYVTTVTEEEIRQQFMAKQGWLSESFEQYLEEWAICHCAWEAS